MQRTRSFTFTNSHHRSLTHTHMYPLSVCTSVIYFHRFSAYSSILENVRTKVSIRDYVYPGDRAKSSLKSYDDTMLVSASGRTVAMQHDYDYASFGGATAGMGGVENSDGADGLVVIISYVDGQVDPSRSVFYYAGTSQIYTVPKEPGSEVVTKTNTDRFIDVKLWGGGGGGGHGGRGAAAGTKIVPPDSVYSRGGGGGFAMARLRVTPGESLTVVVGGGGQQRIREKVGGKGGFNGGGDGGHGIDGGGGGGGGGMTAVLRGSIVLAAAGGGGGGGSTDYCCAHGGGGGGDNGGVGSASGSNTPLDSSKDGAVKGSFRNDYSASEYIAEKTSDAGLDERDGESMPPYHEHLDRGFAPNASYAVLATGGAGGSNEHSSPGLSGVSGSYSVDLIGELNYMVGGDAGGATMATVTDSGGSFFALAGQSMLGGRGADGKEGGGGGGAGYYGGGGGGSGVDGAGGGGGSGFIDYTAVYAPPLRRGHGGHGPNKPAKPEAYKIKHDSFSVRWNLPPKGAEADTHKVRAYDVEVSKGRDGAGGEPGDCSDEWFRQEHFRIGRNDEFGAIAVKGLESETKYCVRVRALSANGLSEESAVTTLVTEAVPRNSWEVVAVRRTREVGKARGGASGVLGSPHVNVDVEHLGGRSSSNADRTFDSPNEKVRCLLAHVLW